MSWVVPGANPALNQYLVVSERASTANTFVITGTTQATAQNVLSLTLTTDYTSNISIWGNFSILSNTNTITNLSYFIETTRAGVTQVTGNIFRSSMGGAGHSLACPILVTTAGTPAGDIIIRLKVFASTASVFTIGPTQLLAIGNISQD